MGAFGAKRHLSSLLDRVAGSEEVVITKHGKPVARLVSAARVDRERVSDASEKLKLLRKRTTLGGLSWRVLRDAGRRRALSLSIRPRRSAGASKTRPLRDRTLCSNGFATRVRSFPDFGIWKSPMLFYRRKSVAGSPRPTSRSAWI